jgi:hypothetical protein
MVEPLNAKERKELRRLDSKWARRTATMAEMERCLDLRRQHEAALRHSANADGAEGEP